MPRLTPRTAIFALLFVATVFYLLNTSTGTGRHERALAASRRREIEAAFDHAWSGYANHCMGHDTLHPVSNTCDDDFGGWGASAIDALSTAIVMRRSEAVGNILHWLESLNFGIVKGGEKINLFEVTIRHLGGLLSAWDLLHGPYKGLVEDSALIQVLYNKITVLGEALTCGFDTPSGVPRNWVDPTACHSDQGTSNSVAGVGTLILEFAKLSEISGNLTYTKLAQKAEEYLLDPHPYFGEPFPGLLGSFVAVKDGAFLDSHGSWGSLADSFYEYLLKAYIYNPKVFARYLERWELAANSTIGQVASHAYGHPEWTFLPWWDGKDTSNDMDALSWFAGGNFILGGMITNNKPLVDFGLSIADTGGAMYSMTATGLGSEYVQWTEDCGDDWGEDDCTANSSVRFSTKEFNLRPEVLETWYYAYRATKNRKYREWAWSAFKAIEKFCKTPTGFSSIKDVTAVDGGVQLDKQESFVFAEVLKYLYLIFSEDDIEFHVQDSRTGSFNTWIFNTEGHPLKVAGIPV